MSAYLPGCSANATSAGLEQASRAVCARLGIPLQDYEWICCGGTPGELLGDSFAETMAMENIFRAGEAGADSLLVGCAGCFRHLDSARHRMATGTARYLDGKEAERGEAFRRVPVEPLWERVARMVTQSPDPAWPGLCGLKVACYYGCRYGRDFQGATTRVGVMESALEALGAKAVEGMVRDECNGGLLTFPRAEIVEERCSILTAMAKSSGAAVIGVLCPLCQLNLETRSLEPPLPAPFFLQLVGLGIGIRAGELGLEKALVDVSGALRAAGIRS